MYFPSLALHLNITLTKNPLEKFGTPLKENLEKDKEEKEGMKNERKEWDVNVQ